MFFFFAQHCFWQRSCKYVQHKRFFYINVAKWRCLQLGNCQTSLCWRQHNRKVIILLYKFHTKRLNLCMTVSSASTPPCSTITCGHFSGIFHKVSFRHACVAFLNDNSSYFAQPPLSSSKRCSLTSHERNVRITMTWNKPCQKMSLLTLN